MTKEEIGSVLKKLRIQSGKTQKEVAEKLGRTQQAIGHWETGYSQPDANTLFLLCALYGASVDNAFGFVQDIAPSTPEESELLAKYRALDAQGKQAVNFMLSTLYERRTQHI